MNVVLRSLFLTLDHAASKIHLIPNTLKYLSQMFTFTSFAPHLFLWGWLKLKLALLLDQLRLAWGDERWW